MKRFIAECRRRRVFRVAALYVVGAWGVLQVASLAFDSWGIPLSVMRSVWLGAIIGFPAALIFGWRYDFVGGRIIRTLDEGPAADLSLRGTDYVILSALAIVVLAMVYGVGTEISTVPVSQPGQRAATIDAKSIAVLPFAVVSSDDADAGFLAVGIQDDLLTRLSKISDLKVISRTSVARYRDTTKSIPGIGEELGVGKILEGGLQRSGDKIRINVQLIDAATDTHIWAETYDRSLTAGNVFAIQTEIVEEIVRRLQASLTPQEAEQLAVMPTESLAAYTAFLKGRDRSSIESIQSLTAAIPYFQSAVELDPDFALAYVGLADAYLTLGANFLGGLPIAESNALAEPPLTKALQLDPDLGEAYATLGLLRQQQGDWQAAEQAYQTAIALQPSYARVFRLYGRLRRGQGRIEESMEYFKKALVVDPFSAPVNVDLGRAYDASGHFDEALQRFLRVAEIEPDHAFAYVYIAAIHYLVYGQVDESLVWYQKAAENDALSPSLQAAQAIAYLELGDTESAKVWIDRGLELGPKSFWAVWASTLFNLRTGDEAASLADARTLLEAYPRNWGSLFVLRNADLAAGRYEVARSRYARAFRELTEPEVPEVNVSNYQAAVDLALVLMHLDEQTRANDLLAGSLVAIETLPRHGMNGYWITDARIFSLQQRPQQALNALRQAVDEGWRIFSWLYLQHDPGLDAIRAEPEFQRLYAEVQADLAAQAERVRELKASGELASNVTVPIAEKSMQSPLSN